MDAVEFLKQRHRMCDMETCDSCPASFLDECDCDSKDIAEIVAIVEQWSHDHPQKTMMQDFFEKFPNAPKLSNGCPKICPDHIYGRVEICTNDCLQCWSRPLED